MEDTFWNTVVVAYYDTDRNAAHTVLLPMCSLSEIGHEFTRVVFNSYGVLALPMRASMQLSSRLFSTYSFGEKSCNPGTSSAKKTRMCCGLWLGVQFESVLGSLWYEGMGRMLCHYFFLSSC